MINQERIQSPAGLFLALAIFLLPFGIVSFHSSWPPLTWKNAHFAEGDIGQTILACSGLFFCFALAFFLFPKLFHRQLNKKLARLHFWANLIGLVLLLAFPIYFNLSFHAPSAESKVDRFFRAFGASLDAYAWGFGAMLVVQVLFLGTQ